MTGDHIRESFKATGRPISQWDLFAASAIAGMYAASLNLSSGEKASKACEMADDMMKEIGNRRKDARP